MTPAHTAYHNRNRLVTKRFLLIILMGVALSFGYGGSASAHVLVQDNGVSSELHMPPYDHPKANEQTTLDFEFSKTDDSSGPFELTNYNISYDISDNNKPIFNGNIVSSYPGDANTSQLKVTFPHVGMYDLKLRGKPTASGSPSFTVDYTIRVESSAGVPKKTNSSNDTGLVIAAGGAVVVIVSIVTVREFTSNKRGKK